MAWKNWPYWLKGASIGAIIPSLFVIGSLIMFGIIMPSFDGIIAWFGIGIILGIPSVIVCSIIGLIVGFIKKKNNPKTNQNNSSKISYPLKGFLIFFVIGVILIILINGLDGPELEPIFKAGIAFIGGIIAGLIGFIYGKIKSRKQSQETIN